MIPHSLAIPIIACVAIAGPEPTKAVRGLATRIEVEYAPKLRPRADQTPYSPILVRVSSLETPNHQRIEFIGTVPGEFDLRDHVEREDGQPISDLARIPITIISQLPSDHGVDLYATTGSWMDWRAHYREFMWGAVALWVAVPVTLMVIRAVRRPRPTPPAPPEPPPPTVAELLRASLEVARQRQLTTEESARLELLLFRFLGGEQFAEDVDLASVLREVREQESTRPLVLAIERWLHAADGGETARVNAASALEELVRTRLTPSQKREVSA